MRSASTPTSFLFSGVLLTLSYDFSRFVFGCFDTIPAEFVFLISVPLTLLGSLCVPLVSYFFSAEVLTTTCSVVDAFLGASVFMTLSSI